MDWKLPTVWERMSENLQGGGDFWHTVHKYTFYLLYLLTAAAFTTTHTTTFYVLAEQFFRISSAWVLETFIEFSIKCWITLNKNKKNMIITSSQSYSMADIWYNYYKNNYIVSQKSLATLFLSELCQISTNCENCWHKHCKDDKLMWGALTFHLT